MTNIINGKKLFGAGRPFATLAGANPTPLRFGVVQDMSLSIKQDLKSLFGEGKYAEDQSAGTADITGKITTGVTNPRIFSDLIFGATSATGQTAEADGEIGTCTTPPSGQVCTLTVTNHSTFALNLGIVDVATGKKMVRVASGSEMPGVSYSLVDATGVYTFDIGDGGSKKKASYLYTVANSGVTIALQNVKQGKAGKFSSTLVFPWTNDYGVEEQDVITLNSCMNSDYELSTKNGDYGKPPFGFGVSCDPSGSLGTACFAEAA